MATTQSYTTKDPKKLFKEMETLAEYLKALGFEEEYSKITLIDMVTLNYEVKRLVTETLKK